MRGIHMFSWQWYPLTLNITAATGFLHKPVCLLHTHLLFPSPVSHSLTKQCTKINHLWLYLLAAKIDPQIIWILDRRTIEFGSLQCWRSRIQPLFWHTRFWVPYDVVRTKYQVFTRIRPKKRIDFKPFFVKQ